MYDDVDRIPKDEGSKLGVHDRTGTITVRNPHGARKTYECEVAKAGVLTHAKK